MFRFTLSLLLTFPALILMSGQSALSQPVLVPALCEIQEASAENQPSKSVAVPALLNLGPPEDLTITTRNGTHNFTVEIADEPAEQMRGMMFREEMGADTGMLFEFSELRVSSIWMKNTIVPLDILFVRANGKILKVQHMAQPCSLRSMSSGGFVAAVLEIKGGRAQELGIAPGDVLTHEFFGNVKKTSEK